jgi:hypothetical protein
VTPCPRCGRPWPSLQALAELAHVVQAEAEAVVAGWQAMRLAVPRRLADATRALAADAPRLAAGLACVAGRCAPPAPVASGGR